MRDDPAAIHKIVERLARGFGVRDVETMVGWRAEALTRFANNTIHQNVAEEGRWLSVRVQVDQKTARATTNRFDEESIQRAVEQALALTNAVEPDPELQPMAEPDALTPVSRFYLPTSQVTPEQRALAADLQAG